MNHIYHSIFSHTQTILKSRH
ncbi:hypothetical protein KTC93_09585 [Clostridium tagluense]|nr:hypothetical protein KTC93_09585 [Clostridium tagluense]